MKTDNWILIETVTAIYNCYSDFDLPIILKKYNEENNTNYTLEDIKEFWIKWNVIYLIMNDEVIIKYEWIIWENDLKRPDELLYNEFESEINNEE